MEILFVSHKYPPAVGGMEKQSYELIQGMKQFTKVHAIVYEGGESRFRFFRMLRKRILQTLQENPGITAIHFNDGLMAAICAGHKGYEHLLRAVTLHGLEVVFPNSLYQRYILPRFNRFDLIIAVSRATAEACIQRGLSPEKVVVIPNGVDAALAETVQRPDFKQFMLERYGVDTAGRRVLVSMGRSVRRKGFSWLIRQVVPQLQGDFVFLMIGPFQRSPGGFEIFLRYVPAFLRRQITLFAGFPTDEAAIRQLLAAPEVQGKVRHLGKLPFEDIRQILSTADAFLMPNIPIEGDMEGFGLVCLEACLCGATVFASRLDGITEAIHDGKNGILLPAGDAEAWASALNALLENPAAFSGQKEAAKHYTLEHFGWDKMAEAYWQQLKKRSDRLPAGQ
ncbi:MAG: glycosyltransferase family 4 protein [Saprospiraceae bacterium]|nr:glycosyltransferase family 4 protein [Saprospiraceae bacterium]